MMRLLVLLSLLAFSHTAPLSELSPLQLIKKLGEYDLAQVNITDVDLDDEVTSMDFCQTAAFGNSFQYVMVWDGVEGLINFPGDKKSLKCATFNLQDKYDDVYNGTKTYMVFAVDETTTSGIWMQAQLNIQRLVAGSIQIVHDDGDTLVYRASIEEQANLGCYASNLTDKTICYTENEEILDSVDGCETIHDDLSGADIKVCQPVDNTNAPTVPEGDEEVNYLAYPNGNDIATISVTATGTSVEVVTILDGQEIVLEGTSTGENVFNCSLPGFAPGKGLYDFYIVTIDESNQATTQKNDTVQDINLLADYADPYVQFVLANEADEEQYQVAVEDLQMRAVVDPINLDCSRLDAEALCFGFINPNGQTDGYVTLDFPEGVIKIPFTTSASRSSHAEFKAIIESVKQSKIQQGVVRLY